MDKRKKIIFISIVLIFFVFCSAYLVFSIRSASHTAESVLETWADDFSTQLQNHVKDRGNNLQYLVHMYHADNITTKEQALALLQQINARSDTVSTYRIVDSAGKIYDATGDSVGFIIDPTVLKTTNISGYGMALYTDTRVLDRAADTAVQAPDIFLEVVPFKAGVTGVYFARTEPVEQLLQCILPAFSPYSAGVNVALFKETSLLASADGAAAAKFSQVEAGLIHGAADFSYSNQKNNIAEQGIGLSFNIYARMSDASSWVVAAHIPTTQVLPFFSSMLTTSLVVFCFLFMLLLLIIVLDVINDREKKKALYRMSCVDSMTGLMNNLGMHDAMDKYLNAFKNGDKEPDTCFVCMDIVSFRRFNNMFGYAAGDKLLRLIGKVLGETTRYAARISNDVFTFVAVSDNLMIADIKGRLYAAITRDFGEKYEQMIVFTFGVFPLHHAHQTAYSPGVVYDGAMMALRTAKKTSDKRVVLYNAALQEQAELQKKIEINMLHALSKEEFQVYIQPKYSVARQSCSGGEALVRWQSEEMGFLMPDSFIPIFEKNAFIVEIDFFMLSSIFQSIQSRLNEGLTVLPIAVNLSRTTLTFPNFIARLKNLVARYPVPLKYVEIEITESALVNDYEKVLARFEEIRKLNFPMAMDDFGAGYSSLNTLRELQVDVLKIDRLFLQESDTSERGRKIIQNIIRMSKEIDIEVVCEGVETKNQHDFLQENGCDYIQGYFYAKPMPYDDYIERYLSPKDSS